MYVNMLTGNQSRTVSNATGYIYSSLIFNQYFELLNTVKMYFIIMFRSFKFVLFGYSSQNKLAATGDLLCKRLVLGSLRLIR